MAPKLADYPTTVDHEESEPELKPRQYRIVWLNVGVFLYYHVAAGYGLYLCFTDAMWTTIGFSLITYVLSALGVTAGVHRLWSHRSYRAKLPLQIFLMLCHSLANQHTVVHWVRDHRLHHKYSDTDADPHNARRGLFYSHFGWLLVRKHAEVKEKGKGLDLSDVRENPVLRFQERHASWFIITVAFIIPTLIPSIWNESLVTSFHLNMLRYITGLNVTLMINSVAHKWGYKPYDRSISPTQSLTLSAMTLGEGYHNYHHVFPCDYRTSELGNKMLNFVTVFIDVCAYFGLAYGRNETLHELVEARTLRTGDGRDLWGRSKKEIRKRLTNGSIRL